ncbi:DNA polymerase III subunit chi [Boseongicola aestuarii]|jgi:DNA polymerase-3 subunit chi|uniref:DNA polymerase III subunit chi n=1 Tax=Boseongicola aestuarii TaxID=1470561 RepID=A0A238IVK1_9RHOB|nr:DNA polymerase III subunit chi [Boseongicola aestuarii]SMX22033.1 DNA polymerase III subunit chi [Boseongicola aestuarii]
MGSVYFYHLTENPLEATLPMLLQKSLAAGWRVAVRSGDVDLIRRLDASLWLGEGFLPHGIAGGPHDADQPVLLTKDEAKNAPHCLMAVGQASIDVEEAKASERVCILFDGADPQAVDHARGLWRVMTDAGLAAQYWADEGGRWQKKAENA